MLGPPITGAGELWAANCMQHMELLLALHQSGPWSLLDMIGEFGWHVLKNIVINKKKTILPLQKSIKGNHQVFME